MLRKYETIIIVRPDLPEEDFTVVKNRSISAITSMGGQEIAFQDWGKKRLAYPIKKSPKGNYLYFRYLSDGAAVFELERNLKVLDSVLRYLTVKLDERVDPETFDFEADRTTIWPFGVKPREVVEETAEEGEEGEEGTEAALEGEDADAPMKPAPAPVEKAQEKPAPAPVEEVAADVADDEKKED
jgi:small subunit ribosomal protein S6